MSFINNTNCISISSGPTYISTGPWVSTAYSVEYDPDDRIRLSEDDFLKLEDKDLMKYIFFRGTVTDKGRTTIKKIDNEEKVGFYVIDNSLKMNLQGVFYKHQGLREWIVYDKSTKKVKISRATNQLRVIFIEEYFKHDGLVRKFIPRLTPTFCKRVVEGKISTLRDIMIYHRSYTLRRKELSTETILKFMLAGYSSFLNVIEDPDNLTDMSSLSRINSMVATMKPFKFKASEIGEVNGRFSKWCKEQSEKFNTLRGSGNGEDGNMSCEELAPAVLGIPYGVPEF